MWAVRKGYVELLAPQKSDPWKLARRRVTASNVEKIMGLSSFGTRQDAIDAILVGKEKSFTVEAQERMDKGTRMEDPLRNFHTNLFPGSVVIEPSLCIGLRWYDIEYQGQPLSTKYPSILTDPLHPNWFIAGSPDGFLRLPNGKIRNLEFKYSEKGYKPLYEHHRKCQEKNWEREYRYTAGPTKVYKEEFQKYGVGAETGALDFFPHIWRSHFYQMQTCMAVTMNTECDYGVGSTTNYYTETVPYDEKYWVHLIYPELIKIIEEEIKPKMTSDHKDLFVKEIGEILALHPEEVRVPVPSMPILPPYPPQ
jgi:hypothetical protein